MVIKTPNDICDNNNRDNYYNTWDYNRPILETSIGPYADVGLQ